MSGARSLLSSRETADLIGCTIPQLRRLAEGGRIPFVKLHRNTLMFDPVVVEAYKVSLLQSETGAATGPWIYFIQMKHSRHVKIGKANDVLERVSTLRCGNPEPLDIILTVPGDRLREHRIHSLLSPYRMEGEWFRWEGAVPLVVARLTENSSWDDLLTWLQPFMDDVEAAARREAVNVIKLMRGSAG